MQLSSFAASSGYQDALYRAAEECGIYRDYWDIFHKRHEITPEIRAGILKALGWDVSSVNSLDAERAEHLRAALASAVPKTTVVGQQNANVPVTLPASANGSLFFQLTLEDGQSLGQSLDVSQLHPVQEIYIDGQRWLTRNLPIAAETPLGYHRFARHAKRRQCRRDEPDCLPRSRLHPRRSGAGRQNRGIEHRALWVALGSQLGLRRFHGFASSHRLGGCGGRVQLHWRKPAACSTKSRSVQYQPVPATFNFLQEFDLHRRRERSRIPAFNMRAAASPLISSPN